MLGEGEGGTTERLRGGAHGEARPTPRSPTQGSFFFLHGAHSQRHRRALGFEVTSKSIQSSFNHHGHVVKTVIFVTEQVPFAPTLIDCASTVNKALAGLWQ